MSKPILGAQLYTLRDFCKTAPDLAETFGKVAKIGYTSVQISGIGPIDPKEVARIIQDSTLKVAVTHMGWDRFLKELDKVIEIHKMWGCEHLAIGGLPGEYFSAEGVGRFIDELTPVAAKLAREGMDFSYHNHNHELAKYGGKCWLDRLYETAPAEVLKAELDTYWIQAGGGEPTAYLRKCAGREPVVHFKDMLIMPNREVRMAEIGEGNLNWPGIIRACEEGGVQYALIEQDTCYGRDPFESLAISYRNLRAMGLR
jgi:sugar phosphate isomerase/epimerase